MTAPLDWIQTLEAARSNVYGDYSDPNSGPGRVLSALTTNNPDYDKLYGGAITAPGSTTPTTWSQATSAPSGVDWSKLPTMGPAGFQLPDNTMWNIVGGRSGVTPTAGVPTYNDPNYGMLQLSQQRAPNDLDLNLLRAGAIAMASIPAAAALGGAAGLGSTGQAALGTAIRAAPTLAQVHWSDVLGGGSDTTAASTPAAAAATPAPTGGLPADYNPGLFGNMGSMAAPPDGSAAVMSSLVPGAYANSNSGPTSMVVA